MSTATIERGNMAGRPKKDAAAYIRVPAYLAKMLKFLALEAGVTLRDYFDHEFRATIVQRHERAKERWDKRHHD